MAAYTILFLLRPAPTRPGAPFPGHEFLMVQNVPRGRRWELPGGCCNPAESPAACAARECAEETGHFLEGAQLLMERDGPFGHGYIFSGRLGARAGEPDPQEISGMRYVDRLPPRDELSFPDDPYEELFHRVRNVTSGPPG